MAVASRAPCVRRGCSDCACHRASARTEAREQIGADGPPDTSVWIVLVVSEQDKKTRRLIMVVIILTAMVAGAFVGRILRPAEAPQPEIADQGTAPPPRALRAVRPDTP